MEKNTVILPLERYDELKVIENYVKSDNQALRLSIRSDKYTVFTKSDMIKELVANWQVVIIERDKWEDMHYSDVRKLEDDIRKLEAELEESKSWGWTLRFWKWAHKSK